MATKHKIAKEIVFDTIVWSCTKSNKKAAAYYAHDIYLFLEKEYKKEYLQRMYDMMNESNSGAILATMILTGTKYKNARQTASKAFNLIFG